VVEARPPGALRCGRRRCSLAPRGDRACVVIQASLLSQVATRLLSIRCQAPALKLKRTNSKKVTKKIRALDLKHR